MNENESWNRNESTIFVFIGQADSQTDGQLEEKREKETDSQTGRQTEVVRRSKRTGERIRNRE